MLVDSDEKLISNYLSGDQKSLEVLIQRYLKPIYNFVYQYFRNLDETEDVTQEVFVKMWRNLKKFNPKKSYFAKIKNEQGKSFRTWIFSIAKNTSIDALRKKRSIPFSEFENEDGKNIFIETLTDHGLLPDELYQRADMMNELNLAVAKLPSEYRLIEQLHCIEQLTFKEISQILNKPLNTLKSQHRRALIRLKKIFQKN